ncbi:MAG: MerR family transcriptional regulator [Candidatus Omnitrophica bacterium]|nr:MerR family transcriptional regulator [Candidatus Omnitrophota bacterium]
MKEQRPYMTITDIAQRIGVVPKTLIRWEKSGKIRRARRDWRNWRAYTEDDLEAIKEFYETLS